jgi:hypothetical protein
MNLRFDPWRFLARRSLEKPLLSALKKSDACVGICGPGPLAAGNGAATGYYVPRAFLLRSVEIQDLMAWSDDTLTTVEVLHL